MPSQPDKPGSDSRCPHCGGQIVITIQGHKMEAEQGKQPLPYPSDAKPLRIAGIRIYDDFWDDLGPE